MDTNIYENEIKIQQRIAKAFQDTSQDKSVAHDIGFHMTDWLYNIKDLQEIYSSIDELNDDAIQAFVYKFLSHVPHHLNAARKLSGMGKVEDVFEVGIFEDDE
ncbi:MAG: hypothetical protein WBD27_09590 [Pyrinomonadaceae bacterium]